jgi:uncharacterized protein
MTLSLLKDCSWKDKNGFTLLLIKAKPNAKRSNVIGLVDINTNYPVTKALEVSINEKPDDNKANIALIELLSDELGVPKSKIELKSGATSRIKVISFKEK